MSKNRTNWPVTGGAIGIQPGWFRGHAQAFFYINLGIGNNPENYSFPMQSVFEITGPSNELYPGSFCLPQVPLPVNFTAVIGQNATIQIIETAQHGAALYDVRSFLSNHHIPSSQQLTRGVYIVCRHHLRRPKRRRRSQRNQLLELDGHWLPTRLQHFESDICRRKRPAKAHVMACVVIIGADLLLLPVTDISFVLWCITGVYLTFGWEREVVGTILRRLGAMGGKNQTQSYD